MLDGTVAELEATRAANEEKTSALIAELQGCSLFLQVRVESVPRFVHSVSVKVWWWVVSSPRPP
jgi:hypothetical protein